MTTLSAPITDRRARCSNRRLPRTAARAAARASSHRSTMPRGVLDVARDGRGAGARAPPPALARALATTFVVVTAIFALGCFLVHEAMVAGYATAFALFPALGFGYLALSVPLAVCYANPDDVRRDLNPMNGRDYAWLLGRTYGAFAQSKDGKVRGKDL